MTVQVLPTIKRFFEGTASAMFSPTGAAREHRRAKDFMYQDLTGSARFYGR